MDEYLDKIDLATRAFTASKVLVPNYQLTHFKDSLLYKGSKLWNELPTEVKQIDSYLGFKDKTKLRSKIQ